MRKLVTKAGLGMSVLLVLTFSGSALAVGRMSNDRAVEAQEAVKARLEGAKLKSCQNREKAINNILDRIAARGEKRLDVYDKIFSRVQDFYTQKNLSVSNYDALVADVNSKKEAAQTALETIKNKDVTFTCDSNDPKGAAMNFKAELKTEISALHAYQQSIKNLIVAVKKSLSDTTQTNNTSTNNEGTQTNEQAQ